MFSIFFLNNLRWKESICFSMLDVKVHNSELYRNMEDMYASKALILVLILSFLLLNIFFIFCKASRDSPLRRFMSLFISSILPSNFLYFLSHMASQFTRLILYSSVFVSLTHNREYWKASLSLSLIIIAAPWRAAAIDGWARVIC